jgi:hypothetical protein
MSDPKEVGRYLGNTNREASRNAARIKANLPSSQRSVDDVNPLNVYEKEFSMMEGAAATLDIDIKERPEPCTVNPPELTSYHNSSWSGEYIQLPCPQEGAVMSRWHCIGEGDTTGEYELITTYGALGYVHSDIILPYDGCYLIEANWGAFGLTYKVGGGFTGMNITVTGESGVTGGNGAGMGPTGIIAILGPSIWYTPSPSRLITMVEAKAGDKVSLYCSAGDFDYCYPWFGTYLRGGFQNHPASLNITLVAIAEDILPSHLEYAPEMETPSAKTKRCTLSTNTSQILNGLVDFYNRLTARGETPYTGHQSWTADEQWTNFWADYWQRQGWVVNNDPTIPYPAPVEYSSYFEPYGLLEYQEQWLSNIIDCPPQQLPDPCRYYDEIRAQLIRLKDFYYATPNLPLYIGVSGSTEPIFFNDWPEYWAWVWDRGYRLETSAYDMGFVWTEAVNTYTSGMTPWPPPTTITDLTNYISAYNAAVSGCQ